ncbi:helix-turn-helix transcriptional regulator [Paenibacillus sp. UNC451MF]|uniref:helix-turn-helix transcriptional regulator n=1 Tax=Paenibacillus sp. UNC451MF TaxID=1449063 RepID=UPI0006902538|nr:helix-turn-helix domain-containing protein [Paenibacillus sp. UNC451MF]
MNSNLLILFKGEKHDYGKVSLHSHLFWQLEIVTRGHITYTLLETENEVLNAGDMLLIPPHQGHEFIYDVPGAAWITLKFERSLIDNKQWGGVIQNSLFTEKFTASLLATITGTILRPYEKTFVEGMLESLFMFINSEDFCKTEDEPTQLVRTVTDMVRERNGRPISIDEIAHQLSYTRSHVSKLFKQLTGENLKSFIDRVRLEKAKEMLRYSEFNISYITEELGFKDIFTFSRFFKRTTGMNPRQYRAKK